VLGVGFINLISQSSGACGCADIRVPTQSKRFFIWNGIVDFEVPNGKLYMIQITVSSFRFAIERGTSSNEGQKLAWTGRPVTWLKLFARNRGLGCVQFMVGRNPN